MLEVFIDKNAISGWASDAVAFISSEGIINGYNGGYHPKESASREVAAIVAKRVAKSYIKRYGEPITVKINDFNWLIEGNLRYDGVDLWIPTSEVMSLLGMTGISLNSDFISGQYYNDQGNLTNCHFSVGAYRYYLDTENGSNLLKEIKNHIK